MFDHVKFGVSDFAASKAFYLKALEPLGVAVVSEGPPTYGIELSCDGKASLCLFQSEEKPAHLHLAFTAGNRQQVEAFYRAALAAGGKDNGAPGLRPHERLKGYYGSVSERQLRRYYLEAVRRRGDTGENLVEILERRLDAVIYRMKFAITVFASRQLVSHGHVKVNGKRVNIASYLVKDNDVIELTSKAKEMERVIESTQTAERDVPEYVTADHKDMKGTFVRGPKLADVPYPVQMEPSLVVEYYSR